MLQLCNPSKLVISKGQNSPQDKQGRSFEWLQLSCTEFLQSQIAIDYVLMNTVDASYTVLTRPF